MSETHTTDPLINDPDPARLIHGLRDTGYDLYTASADIIDNSIAAGADNVQIRIDLAPDGRKFVYFGDDGCGMNDDGLKNAMRYGAKIRAELASLGKFGLGLKTASSSICLKYSLISRQSSTDPLRKLTWDLEEVAKNNIWKMSDEEITNDQEETFEELCGEGSGTLVVWERCDRLLGSLNAEPGGTKEKNAINYRIKKLKEHCALIFHKFLNPNETTISNINISINAEPVAHWNPFYPSRSEQMLPSSETKMEVQREDGSTEIATVKAWILPHSKDMTKEENEEFAKISNRGQGLYIHREGRIIHHGGYLGLWRADDPHWSLFRIEFDFGHKLDEAFSVDVKKSKIILDPALEEALKELLTPAHKEADNRYRRKQVVAVAGGVSHGDSNKTIGEIKNIKQADVSNADPSSSSATINNNVGSKITVNTPVQSNVNPDNLYFEAVDDVKHGFLWEPCLNSATTDEWKTGVRINQNHDFYTKVYSRMNSGMSIEGLDLLLWALAAAEFQNTNDELKDVWDDIREEVSSNLRKLLKNTDLPS